MTEDMVYDILAFLDEEHPGSNILLTYGEPPEAQILAALALKSHLYPDTDWDERKIDEAVAQLYPLIRYYDDNLIIRCMPERLTFLSEEAVANFNKMYREKFGDWDALLRTVPASNHDTVLHGLRNFFDFITKDNPFINRLKVLDIRYAHWLGTLIVFDVPQELSVTAFARKLSKIFDGEYIGVVGPVPHSRGVGVRIYNADKDWKVWPTDIFNNPWLKCYEGGLSLPMPLGLDDSDNPFVIDLTELNTLVFVSGDTEEMGQFAFPQLDYLISRKSPLEVKFMFLKGQATFLLSGLANRLREYRIGSQEPPLLYTERAEEVEKWCAYAMAQLAAFENELKTRERLFKASGCETFDEFRAKTHEILPRWVCCISALPAEVRGASDKYEEVISAMCSLVYSDLARFGMHLIFITFRRFNLDLQLAFHNGLNDGNGLGMVVMPWGTLNTSDSYALIGGPEACRVGWHRGLSIYKSPLGEVHEFCLIKGDS